MTTTSELSESLRTQAMNEADERMRALIASGDLLPAACVGCGSEMYIHRTLPASMPEHLRHLPRVPTCEDCAAAKVAAADSVQVFPRNTESQEDTSVTINIDTLPDAEVGAAVKAELREQVAQELPAKQKAAKKDKAKKAAKDKAAAKRERAAIKAIECPAFTVGDIEVPALDLSDLTSLNEEIPAVLRKAYNQAAWRVDRVDVPHLTERGALMPSVTYAQLIEVHQALAVAKPPKKEKAPKAKKEVAAVEVEVNAPAKKVRRKDLIAILMADRGMSKKEAKQALARLG